MRGSELVYEGRFEPTGWWSAVRELGATHVAGAPTGFRQLALAGVEATGGPLPALGGATAVGEPLDADVIAWFRENLGIAIHDGYGLSELGMITGNLRPGEPVPGSMGVELPGFRVRLVDDDGADVAEGETGHVAVHDHGYLLATTYWGRDDEWRARLRDGWWLTEDLARRDEHGRYWYLSRADDVIVTAGYNVGPFEVETVLLEHPLVADAACVAEPDARKGQVPVAHVVLTGAEPPSLPDDLKRWVGERIGWHASPRRVYVHSELPRTESGKVRRAQLRAGSGAAT
jgi:acetyl-CoA synthetase